MNVPDMCYAITTRYNVILVYLSSHQNITVFPMRTRQPTDSRQHKLICIRHVRGSHFLKVN